MLVAQLCLTLCHLMDCSLPGSSGCGILQCKNTGVYNSGTHYKSYLIPFSYPGIELKCPAWQVYPLPSELLGRPLYVIFI